MGEVASSDAMVTLKPRGFPMRTLVRPLATLLPVVLACAQKPAAPPASAPPSGPIVGMAGVRDDASQKDVVKIAAGSPDHTTLVAAVTAAKLVDVLASSGPYTVFAPTNAAFDQLPKGTVGVRTGSSTS